MILKSKCLPIINSITAMLLLTGLQAFALLNLGPEEVVQANGADLVVNGYSVPSVVDWNNDSLADLIIGEGGGSGYGKVRIYLNDGSVGEPAFSEYIYAQSGGADLTETASGCMGIFPRVVYWDGNALKDLLVGTSQGNVRIYLNIGSDTDPIFDEGTTIQWGQPPFAADIDVGNRATPTLVDWNSDGRRDLVIGAYDGRIHLYIIEGTDTEPFYLLGTFAQEDGGDLTVPSSRSSSVISDLDDDGKKDILTGNTNGQLLFYSNIGSDDAPTFSGYEQVEADGIAIELAASRSRPYVCDWTGDGMPDVLIGASDGKVHLFQGNLNVIDAELTCLPSSGTVPFTTTMTVTLTNNSIDQLRQIAGHIDATLASGTYFNNWRAGYTNVAPSDSYIQSWSTTIPALGSMIGDNVFTLVAEDVTPSPYNQPPYPSSGDTATDTCTVTGVAPR